MNPKILPTLLEGDIRKATNYAIKEALAKGAYVGIASHDQPVVDFSLKTLNELKMGPGHLDPRSNAGAERKGKGAWV